VTGERLQALLALLDGADVRDRIARMIAELDGIGAADAAALRASMDERLRSIAASLRDLCVDDDTSEAQAALPSIWLELRFEWMRYNLQMQYQTVFRGTADTVLMARGAALSYVLEAIEQELDAESAFLVQKIAADPAAAARGAIERTDRLFAFMGAASAGGRDAVEVLMAAQERIAHLTDAAPVHREMSRAVGGVIERVGAAMRVSLDDFTHALEGALLRRLGRAPVRVALARESPDPYLTLPSAVASALLEAAAGWMDALRETGIPRSAEARIADGYPAHVTLHVCLTGDADRYALTLADDADGRVAYAPNLRAWPMRDLRVTLERRPGLGHTITFRCEANAVAYGGDVVDVAEYLTVCASADPGAVRVCVPLRAVDQVERRDASALALHGARLLDGRTGRTVRLVDLGAALFGTPLDAAESTYVYVRPSGTADPVALRVLAVNDIVRGTAKPVPELLAGTPLRGFVQADRRAVGVLDLDRLLGLDDTARQLEILEHA
jgi:hypothetical protein